MSGVLGTPIARSEGPGKVRGTARYAAEYQPTDLVHAWVVQSHVARGTVRDVRLDREVPGVLAVLWHANCARLRPDSDAELQVLQNPEIFYHGQAVAVVVAETPEQAREAAERLEVQVEEAPHDCVLSEDHPGLYTPEKVNPGFPSETAVGDVDAALSRAAIVVDSTYRTPAEHNSPMEPHASIAFWEGDALTVYDSNQGPSSVADTLATLFGLETDRVRVVAEHVGGGFGAKGSARPNVVLAALAARVVGRPVKLVLPRQALFSMVGYRTPTIQRVRLGADREGRLSALSHDAISQTSRIVEFAEQTATCSRHMYAAAARRTGHRLARLDVPSPRWMRAPGECPGMFALESAMDELAAAVGIDPIELRVRNEPAAEPESGVPFTSRNYLRCLHEGAARFGWAQRDPRPGVRREGEELCGTGVAGAMYPVNVMPSSARATLEPAGTFRVEVGAADIGTGARTVLAQIAAETLGVGLDRVRLLIGDSRLPHASVAGGSSGTSSWGWAVSMACGELRRKLDDLGDAPSGQVELSAFADTSQIVEDLETDGKHAFGAHFADVRVDTVTGHVRVARLLGWYAAGRILNPRTARSQFLGGMTMGLGMALHEEGLLDPAGGDYVNHDLAGYHIPTHADIEQIDVGWVQEEDDRLNPTRSKGIGEIGIVGTAAAVANAVWHATGIRFRSLPLRPDRVLQALEQRNSHRQP
ncbi:MAG TPA: xanthine dehydrogenase family protein molybdopterin-binding subunit [Actinospica sp.]|nr:xanthine dehydrogenase family protein molybdopterin-binding subunit [Actinospica sp.]